MTSNDLNLTPVARAGLAVAERVFGLTCDEVVTLAVEEFLRSRGLLPSPEASPKGHFRGIPEMALVRNPGL